VHQDIRNYTQKGLQGHIVDVVDSVFREEQRRVLETREFVQRLCLLDKRGLLWYQVWQSGGVRGFGEILSLARSLGIRSDNTVTSYLKCYVELGLAVRLRNGYRMIAPVWLEG